MTLARKATLAFAVLIALVTTGQLIVVSQARSSAAAVQAYRGRIAVFQDAVRSMITDWYTYDDQNNMYILVAATSPDETTLISDTWAQGIAGKRAFMADLAKADRTAPASAQPMLQRVKQDFASYDRFALAARAQEQAGHVGAASVTITVSNAKVSNALMADLLHAQRITTGLAAASESSLSAKQSRVVVIAGVAGAIIVILLVGLGLALQRMVLRPIRLLGSRMADIATGDADLTVRVPVQRKDEIGALAGAFNTFIERIQAMMIEFSGAIEEVSQAAADLRGISATTDSNAALTSRTAHDVASSAHEVEGNISEVAAGTEQMRSAVSEIARNAVRASTVASAGRQHASDTTARVKRLADASAKIDNVVRLIAGVAEQTNLLALNATIEAARAGEAGKGFAVVAGEVKDLASQTGEATRSITDIVIAIQNETEETVESINQITALIAEMGEVQDTISAAVEEQSASTAAIADSADLVTRKAGEIARDIVAVAEAGRETSVGVATSSARIDDLTRISAALGTMVGQFRTS